MGLEHPALSALGLRHAFGTRGDTAPEGLIRPRQVHGTTVVDAALLLAEHSAQTDAPSTDPSEVAADAIFAVWPLARPVGVVTADCVPIFVASDDGRAVVAIHAGWRGLAAGVIEGGVRALREQAPGAELVAVIGPHIGACCYEVDAPVLAPLRARYGAGVESALRASRAEHWWLDLRHLARAALLGAGLDGMSAFALESSCTHCDARRFHSYRRDGPRAGRLLHWIAAGRSDITPAGGDRPNF